MIASATVRNATCSTIWLNTGVRVVRCDNPSGGRERFRWGTSRQEVRRERADAGRRSRPGPPCAGRQWSSHSRHTPASMWRTLARFGGAFTGAKWITDARHNSLFFGGYSKIAAQPLARPAVKNAQLETGRRAGRWWDESWHVGDAALA